MTRDITTAPTPATPDPSRPEVVAVHSRKVACDGGGGALGHPLVWLEMGEQDFVECGYCDRRFVLAGRGSGAEIAAPGVYETPQAH